jgi:glycosyltransferase involved in cell wall biosynthesis
MSTNHAEKSTDAKVTIGVCVKNSAKTIREAIQSIIQQDYPPELLEIIFVDDGSDDNTLLIINEYAKRMNIHARVFHHKWKGLGASRDIVVDNATGRYIVWVDGDMILPRDHVRKQVEFAEQNPKIGIAKAKYGTFDGKSLVSFLENVSYITIDKIYGEKVTVRTLGTGGAIYRIDAIRQAGGFDPNMIGVGEDMDAEFRVRQAGWLLYLGSPAVFYEQHRKSLRAIWDEGFWYGYGGNSTFRKNTHAFFLPKMTPLAGVVAGAWFSAFAYRFVHKKAVFLLPLHRAFKQAAWCTGFFKAQMDRL